MLRLIIFLVLLWLVVGCKPADTANAVPLTLFSEPKLALKLAPGNVPVETPLQLQLTAENVVRVNGQLTGVSMYMGKVPLKFNQNITMWQAEFLLGACSDPHMVWQLDLELHFVDGKTRKLTQQFKSSW